MFTGTNACLMSRMRHKVCISIAPATSRLHYALVTTIGAMQIFVLSSSRIQQRGYDTLFNYTTANPKSGVSKFVKQFPPKAQVSSLGIAHGTATKLHRLQVIAQICFGILLGCTTLQELLMCSGSMQIHNYSLN